MENHLVDVFDDNYNLVASATKTEAHEKGLWHRVFTCIFVNPDNKTVILQKKHSNRYGFNRPDYVDITVGGHYEMGETIDKGVREISEEVGIDVDFEDLISLGVRQTASTITPNYIANEFQHLFLCPSKIELIEYKIDDDEVSGLVEVSIDLAIDLLLGKTKSINAKHLYCENESKKIKEIELSLNDFVPAYLNKDQLYLHMLIAAKRYINGEDKSLLIW